MADEAKEAKKQASRILSEKLMLIGMELHDTTVDEDGSTRAINKLEALARRVWERALGYTEKLNTGRAKQIAPAQWAISLIFERLEGKVMPQLPKGKEETSVPLSDRVSDLSKQKMSDFLE